MKVLPLLKTGAEVEALDEAWRRLGFKNRSAMIRMALAPLLPSQVDAPSDAGATRG